MVFGPLGSLRSRLSLLINELNLNSININGFTHCVYQMDMFIILAALSLPGANFYISKCNDETNTSIRASTAHNLFLEFGK